MFQLFQVFSTKCSRFHPKKFFFPQISQRFSRKKSFLSPVFKKLSVRNLEQLEQSNTTDNFPQKKSSRAPIFRKLSGENLEQLEQSNKNIFIPINFYPSIPRGFYDKHLFPHLTVRNHVIKNIQICSNPREICFHKGIPVPFLFYCPNLT